MGEELAEHEGVVRLWVVLGELDVFVHIEGHYMLESTGERVKMSE